MSTSRTALVVLVALVVVAVGCGGGDEDAASEAEPAGAGPEPTSTTTAPATASTVTPAPTATAPATTTTATVTGSPGDRGDPVGTPSASDGDPDGQGADADGTGVVGDDDEGAERATGSGTVTIDGEPAEVSVVACGWLDGGTSAPLSPVPNPRDDFRLLVTAGPETLDEAFLVVELDRDGVVGTTRVTLGQVATTDSSRRNLDWRDLLRGTSWLDVDGARVSTPEPLPIADGDSLSSDDEHLVGIDVTCDTFGGVIDDTTALLSDELGYDLGPSGSGTVTIGGEVHEVEVTECFDVDDGSWGVTAVTADGGIEIEVSDNGLGRPEVFSDQIHLDVGEELYVARTGVDAVRDGDVRRLARPVELVEIVSEEPFTTVDFEITCD